jgi:hypothetical protein
LTRDFCLPIAAAESAPRDGFRGFSARFLQFVPVVVLHSGMEGKFLRI